MSFAHEIARKLKNQPRLKRLIKNAYQCTGTILSDKKTTPEDIVCVSDENYENLFGYYDKSPWNHAGTQILYLRVPTAQKQADSADTAQIILKDLKADRELVIGKTNTWNVQQSCMLQWLGNNDNRVIYNDFRNGKFCSVIIDLNDNSEKIIDTPVYSVSRCGKFALSLDFSRLHALRPGYGYCNLADAYKNEKIPEGSCIAFVDLEQNQTRSVIDYEKLISLSYKGTMKDAYHKVNHIMLNPSGDRFIFMHRWILNGVKHDRLLSSNLDGSDIRILLDYDMVSHCNWKNDTEIIAFANYKDEGYHYYSFSDIENAECKIVPDMPKVDGHPSYSPNGKYIITDTYPSFKRKQALYLYDVANEKCVQIASIYANGKYTNETRCDLHPRWKSDSSAVCFDGAQQSRRQVYILNISKGVAD